MSLINSAVAMGVSTRPTAFTPNSSHCPPTTSTPQQLSAHATTPTSYSNTPKGPYPSPRSPSPLITNHLLTLIYHLHPPTPTFPHPPTHPHLPLPPFSRLLNPLTPIAPPPIVPPSIPPKTLTNSHPPTLESHLSTTKSQKTLNPPHS